jgi:ElaB/YqjD/DUF883 family membrane-anchored ribosome-binding protein
MSRIQQIPDRPRDEFALESPWKSIAFAALGGIVIGMLIAR